MTDQEEEPWIEDGDNTHRNNDEEEAQKEEEEDLGGFSLFGNPRGEFHLEFQATTTTTGKIKITLKGIKSKFPMFLQSTGLTLWQSSKNLCTYLCDHADIVQNKKVVELGAGLGLAGIVAYKLDAAKVVLTDGDTDTLENMRENVSLNVVDDNSDDVQITCRQLRWGRHVEEFRTKWTHNEGFDIVMGSDIIYAKEYIEVLFQTVSTLLSSSKNSMFLLSHMKRNPSLNFDDVFNIAEQNGFQWSAPDGGVEEGMYKFFRS